MQAHCVRNFLAIAVRCDLPTTDAAFHTMYCKLPNFAGSEQEQKRSEQLWRCLKQPVSMKTVN